MISRRALAVPFLAACSLALAAVAQVATAAAPAAPIVAAALLLTATPVTAATTRTADSEAQLAGFDAFIESAMGDWEVPGLALAVVRDGEVLLSRGYGVRRKGGTEPVDADTLFAIGSSSKAFTAACVALLVDQKKVGWDDPVTKHLPGFELHDPYATRELTVRDLLTHRSGLARGDSLWYGSGFDRAEILERVRHLEPSWSFRSKFGYQNLMFLAAGELYAAVAGESWDDCVAKRFFAPLGMARSTTSVDPLPGIENVASPHERLDDQVVPVAWRDLDNVAPAGSVNSSAREMAAWVKLQLARGGAPALAAGMVNTIPSLAMPPAERAQTRAGSSPARYSDGLPARAHAGTGADAGGEPRVLAEATVTEMHTPQMAIRKEGSWATYFPASRFITYGLGWFVNDYRGEVVVEHGGSIDGMRALVSMIPERNLGLVVLTNRGGQNLPEVVRYRAYDLMLGLEPKDWSTELLAANAKARDDARKQREKIEAERVSGTRASLPLEAYVRDYEHPLYGRAALALEKGALVLRRGEGVADLEHWHYDTFRARFRNPLLGTALVTFRLDASGRPDELLVPELGVFSARSDPPDPQ
jgi:CubicO group peptidase (beta-lactamase class C family)